MRVGSSRIGWVWAGLPMVLAAAWWLPHVDATPAWRDEAATLLFAGLTPAELWGATSFTDRSMVPYYLLVSPLTRLPEPLLAVRLLSFAAFLATVGAAAAVALRLWGPVAALVAGVFLAAHRPLALHGLEARSYTLFAAAFTLATLALVLLGTDDGPRRFGWTAAYGVLITLAVAMNVLASVALVSHLAYVLVRPGGLPRRGGVVAGWTVAAAAGVALVWMSRGQTGQLSWLPEPSPRFVVSVARDVFLGKGLGLWVAAVLLLIAVLGVVAALVRGRLRWSDPGLVLGVGMALGPIAILTAFSLIAFPVLYPRYLVAGTVGAALLCGFGIGLITRPWPRVALGGAVLGTVLTAAVGVIVAPEPPTNPDGHPALADHVKATIVAGDHVVTHQVPASTGVTGALALALGDDRMWQQAVNELFDGPAGLAASRVLSTTPWVTETEPAYPLRGRIHLVALGERPDDVYPGCPAVDTATVGGTTITVLDCP